MLKSKKVLDNQLHCPVCKSADASSLETIPLSQQHAFYSPDSSIQVLLNKSVYIQEQKYIMNLCHGCRLEFAWPFKAPSPSWYEIVYSILDLYPSSRWEFHFLLSRINSCAKLAEIGCGDGSFLQLCAKKGVSCVGVDFSESAIVAARAKGLDVHFEKIGTVNSELKKLEKRTVVVAFHVLEHLDNPSLLFETAYAWSGSKASLWVAVPSDRRPHRYFCESDYLDQPPHHMTRWTKQALAILGDNQGWEMKELFYEPAGFRCRLWWISTRHKIYLHLKKQGFLAFRFSEVSIRAVISILTLFKASASSNSISGQSMIAYYTKKNV